MFLKFADAHESAPDGPRQDAPDVQVWRTPAGDVIARGFVRGDHCYMEWPSLATFRFSAGERHITAFPETGTSRSVVADVYTRSVLPMALQAFGHEALHASAIVVPATGVCVFAADSETGKSTIAYGLRQRGYRQWSDDGVVFTVSDRGATALPLPFSVRLRPGSSAIVPIDSDAQRPDDHSHLSPTTIGAICVLSRETDDDAAPAAIELLRATDAFAALLPHALEFNPFDRPRRARLLKNYLDVAATVPVLRVRFRPGADAFPKVLDLIVTALKSRVTSPGVQAVS